MKLHFLRHGQTELSRDNSFCGSGSDPDLTADGEAMAEAFASFAGRATESRAFVAVHSSPQLRARRTAAPIAARLGLEARDWPELREIGYGAWEGRSVDDVRRDDGERYAAWRADPVGHPPPGGESALAVAERALHVIEALRREHPTGDVLVVSHKATIRLALCALLGFELSRFRQRLACPVASLATVELAAEGPILLALADRSHLDERLRALPGT
jgi:broad specificity phosphatase PhoE